MYKRQDINRHEWAGEIHFDLADELVEKVGSEFEIEHFEICLLYTSDAADERSSVDLGGRRIIKKKTGVATTGRCVYEQEKGEWRTK